GYVPPVAWSPDGRLLALSYGDALHVLDVDANRMRTIPLPRIPLQRPLAVRWAIFGLVFGQSARQLYVLGVPAAQAPAVQGLQRVYRIDPTSERPHLRRLAGDDVLGSALFDYGARSPAGRFFAAPLWVHDGGCRDSAGILMLDLQTGRMWPQVAFG